MTLQNKGMKCTFETRSGGAESIRDWSDVCTYLHTQLAQQAGTTPHADVVAYHIIMSDKLQVGFHVRLW